MKHVASKREALLLEERYLLNNHDEIRNQFRILAREKSLIAVSFNGGADFMLTTVVGVHDDMGLLCLDFGADRVVTRRAIESGSIECRGKCGGVPFQFVCESLRSARFEGAPTIAAAIPNEMFRIQRREFYRVATQQYNGPACLICDPISGSRFELSLGDISLGGVGLIDTTAERQLQLSKCYHGCVLHLPGLGDIDVALRIRSQRITDELRGREQHRYGASFEQMAVADNALLQRYIFRLQQTARQPLSV